MSRLPFTCLVLGALLPAAAVAQNPDSVQITTERIADGVYLLQGSGGNVGISAGGDGIILIDDQYAPLTTKIKAAVTAISPAPIRFVINTHYHGDHTGGNRNLSGDGTLIVAHENVRRRMSTDQFIAAFNAKVAASPAAAWPVVTFTDTLTFYLNGDTIQVVHVQPAHTDGDAIIVFRHANVVHTGDTFFNGFYPFIDVSGGGTLDGMIAACDRVLAIANEGTRIIPGHGPLATRADLRRYRDMLLTVRTRFTRARNQGMSIQQVLEAELLKDLDAVWGNGFMTPAQFAAVAYNGLAPR